MEGNASQHHVRFVSGNATRIPDVNGLCKTHAAQQSFIREAKSIVGTVPMIVIVIILMK